MIIEPKPPYGYTIFCDDIRQEVNGKTTHVGIYAGEMSIVSEGNAVIPQLCALLVYRDLPDTMLTRPVLYKLIRSSDKGEQVLLEAPFNPPPDLKIREAPQIGRQDGTNFTEIRLEAKLAPFIVEESCLLKSRIYVGDDEVLCGALRVILVTPDQVPTGVVH